MNSDFTFSFEKAEKTYKNVETEHENIRERIDKILNSSKFFVSDFPVLKQVVNLSTDPSDLKMLSKAFDRLADLYVLYNDNYSKYILLKAAKENSNWFMSSCGDFAKEVDDIINTIQGENI
jgi:hypothetical protein